MGASKEHLQTKITIQYNNKLLANTQEAARRLHRGLTLIVLGKLVLYQPNLYPIPQTNGWSSSGHRKTAGGPIQPHILDVIEAIENYFPQQLNSSAINLSYSFGNIEPFDTGYSQYSEDPAGNMFSFSDNMSAVESYLSRYQHDSIDNMLDLPTDGEVTNDHHSHSLDNITGDLSCPNLSRADFALSTKSDAMPETKE